MLKSINGLKFFSVCFGVWGVVLFWFFSLVWFLVLAFYTRSSSTKSQMTPLQGTMTSGRSPACCLTSSCLPSLFSRDFLDPLSGWGVKLLRVLWHCPEWFREDKSSSSLTPLPTATLASVSSLDVSFQPHLGGSSNATTDRFCNGFP